MDITHAEATYKSSYCFGAPQSHQERERSCIVLRNEFPCRRWHVGGHVQEMHWYLEPVMRFRMLLNYGDLKNCCSWPTNPLDETK